MKFEEWFKKIEEKINNTLDPETKSIRFSPLLVREAWCYQQKRIDELIEKIQFFL